MVLEGRTIGSGAARVSLWLIEVRRVITHLPCEMGDTIDSETTRPLMQSLNATLTIATGLAFHTWRPAAKYGSLRHNSLFAAPVDVSVIAGA